MANFANFGENKIADFFRAQGLTLPANWYIAPGSAGSDAGITEITGLGIGRATVVRSLTNWAGTQSAGSTLASNGTSKLTSNNGAISFGTASGSGSVTHVGFLDAASAGNCWIWVELATPIAFVNGDPVAIAAGALKLKVGLAAGATHYLVNKFIDLFFRGQTFAWPTTIGFSYFTTAPTDAGGGVEASGGGYARASLTPSLTSISGTQGPGTTSASSGSSGRISNNAAIAHPAPTGNQGTVMANGRFDAPTAGNLLFWKAVTPFTVVAGGPAPTYEPDAWAITVA